MNFNTHAQVHPHILYMELGDKPHKKNKINIT